jgi:hypothetical protein
VYALHSFSLLTGIIGTATIVGAFLTGWPSIIAVILNYVKRSEARGTWLNRTSDGRSGRSGSDCCGSRFAWASSYRYSRRMAADGSGRTLVRIEDRSPLGSPWRRPADYCQF